MRASRDSPVGALHSEKAAVTSGYANRPSAIAARGNADKSAGHSGCTSTRGAARSLSVLPRVMSDAIQFGHAHIQPTKL